MTVEDTWLTVSEEQLKDFLEAVKADAGLQEKLKATSNFDAVVAIANEEGFLITADNLQQAQSELSEQELESVTGGTFATTAWVLTVVVK